jgi:hypothetical protein
MTITGSFFNNRDGLNQPPKVAGELFEGFVEIALDTYVTNGLTVANLTAPLNLKQVIDFMPYCIGPTITATLNDFSYDRANGKVKFYNGTTEITNGTDISAFKLYARVTGYK